LGKDSSDKRRTEVSQTLHQLLGGNLDSVGKFRSRFVFYAGCNSESIIKNHVLLKEIGFTDVKMARNIILLVLPNINLRKNYDFLTLAGVDKAGLISSPNLLSLNPNTLKRNYLNLSRIGVDIESNRFAKLLCKSPHILYKQPASLNGKIKFMKEKGLKEEKILENLPVLDQNLKVLKWRWAWLRNIGLSDQNIATNVHLLSMNKKTLLIHYNNLRRYFEKEKIATFAPMLGISTETINANVQFLQFWGLTPDRVPLAYLSSPTTKRKKVAWLMKQILRPGHTLQEASQALGKIRKLYSINPKFLVYSLATLESKKDRLIARLA
jgi:hypothetical protein